MNTYRHDYTLPSEAESKVYEAFLKCSDQEIKRLLEDAQQILRKYLSQDNLVKSNDVADGFVKSGEIFDDDQLDFIRDIMGEYVEQRPKASTAVDAIEIINICQRQLGCEEFRSVGQFLKNTSNTWTEIKDA